MPFAVNAILNLSNIRKRKKQTELVEENNPDEMLNSYPKVSNNDELLAKRTRSKTHIHCFNETVEKNGKPTQGEIQYEHPTRFVKCLNVASRYFARRARF